MKNFLQYVDERNFSREDYDKLNDLALSGKLKDDDNPIFVFSTIKTSLLRDLLSGKYNVMDLIKFELEKRR